MRNRESAPRARILLQGAAVAALAALAAACSANGNRVEPLFTGSTANQRAIIGDAQPAPAVAQAPLPAYAANGPVNLAGGQGAWSAVGGNVITVAPGESLDSLALKYGVPSSEIARANGISSPSQIVPGRALVIPRQAQTAFVSDPQSAPMPAASAPAAQPVAASGGVHVVKSGETLYSLSRQYGVSVSSIVAANSITNQNIRIGQSLRIPAGGAAPAPTQVASLDPAAGANAAAPKPLGSLKVDANGTPKPPEAIPTAAAAPQPAAPVVPAKAEVAPLPTPAVAAVQEPVDPPSANGTTFRWPVRGRIISGYGAKPNGEKNDGINLAVPEGTSVKAAEAGTVIYAGNELAGYGNLVLIRHADGWVSAYAHNSEINVNRGDAVQRGSIIGKAGQTGSVSSPQVHFELRKGAKPVNPMDYLSNT